MKRASRSGVDNHLMRVIRATGGDKLRDDARTHKTLTVAVIIREGRGGAKRLGHANIQNTVVYAALVSHSRERKAREYFLKLPRL